jgi:TolB-like protein/DNA-binding winged helix-turn-helix (wHTH) protein/Tfp pilus assembly protein PilF
LLLRDGKPVRLGPKPMLILCALVEKCGMLVEREELIERVWPNVFVEDGNLTVNVFALRKALAEGLNGVSPIETIPKRGYRFVAEVREAASTSELAAYDPRSDNLPVHQPIGGGTVSASPASAERELATEAKIPRDETGSNAIESLAVLPLENLSHDPEQEYFADGISDQLITEVARVGRIRVISRTSVQCYKGVRAPLPEVARKLNVHAIVEGTVLRSGGRVRITAQLIDARRDEHLWAETYERDLRNVLVLQAEVAQAIAEQVHATLARGPRLQSRPARPVDPAAFESFVRGRYFWNKRTEESIRKAIDYFRQAIEADPAYAPAYAGMAECYLPLGYHGYLPPADAFPKAKAWAIKALEIDEQLSEARTVLGGVQYKYERNPQSARRELQEAVGINPNYARGRQVYSEFLTSQGEFEPAAEEIRRALELDPLSPVLYWVDAQVSYLARQYEEAATKCRKSLEVESAYPLTHFMLGLIKEQLGQFGEAVEHLQQATNAVPSCYWFQAELARACALGGKEDEARTILRRFEKLLEEKYVSAYSIAKVYAGLGEREEVLRWLGRALEERSSRTVFLTLDPAFDAFRDNTKFRELLRRAARPAE